MAEIKFNSDGTIQELPWWDEGKAVEQMGRLNPYNRTEAETIAWSEGLKTEKQTEWERDIPWNRGKKVAERMVVTSIQNGDFIKVQGVDFSKGVKSLDVNVASINGGRIEVRAGSINGELLGIVNVTAKGESDIYRTISATMRGVTGVRDVYFVFKGEKDLFNFDWWQFKF